jgi:uncharacterized RDD family membrane protein YckC
MAPSRLRIPERADRVTQEPLVIAPELLDAPLATFRRRAAAYLIDLVLFAALVGAGFLALSLASIQREEPTLLPRLRDAAADPGSVSDAERRQLTIDLLRLVDRRAPDALPADLAADFRAGRADAVVSGWGERDLVIALASGRTRMTAGDGRWTLSLGTDVTLGEFSGFFSWGAIFVGWFTVLTRLGRGRTPGKRLLGLRVARLDGRPLRWWDAFGRAGGYGASAATLMLGFIEMIWDPNRQALHDRIARTVVLHGRGRRSESRRA